MPISKYISDIRAKIGNDLLILTGASAVVINERGEVLLQRRSDLDIWTLLGGYLDPGEDVADGIIREVREEAGITIVPEQIVAVLSGRDHFHTYDNGHRVAVINICFRCRPIDDTTPRPNDDESVEVRYFPPGELPENTFPIHKTLIAKAIEYCSSAYFRPPSA
ncbi:MAG: NUDIX domain-containing protein [Chloroflexi bacterium]|nr:NUDIX domain-containing protein [Chloroflexota bacterium]